MEHRAIYRLFFAVVGALAVVVLIRFLFLQSYAQQCAAELFDHSHKVPEVTADACRDVATRLNELATEALTLFATMVAGAITRSKDKG